MNGADVYVDGPGYRLSGFPGDYAVDHSVGAHLNRVNVAAVIRHNRPIFSKRLHDTRPRRGGGVFPGR